MKKISKVIQVILLSMIAYGSPASVNIYEFEDPVKKERFYQLIDELRCTVCQNQTIAESNAGLAKDLRNRVYTMIQEGKTDKEIKTFMVERFTDFVLYKPPVNNSTLLLWAGPAILMLAAFIFLLLNIRKRLSTPTNEIDEQQHKRVQALLEQENNHD